MRKGRHSAGYVISLIRKSIGEVRMLMWITLRIHETVSVLL